ncbi:hypothetical protein CPLU01_12519 [Colletotrichum plurivorum]|uniref:AB hydrolase-1 domain-containing protein n=1 Tax=Colletotrichum plurivorum TaxID=2175906 RepID=A0A8H6JZ25_9PEZI|nr:hypothetical protein CPLU01_12519 [Colletotrichum plurivorum]
MVNKRSSALAAAFAATAAARTCKDLTIEVSISARNGVFNYPVPKTTVDVTNFAINLAQQGHNLTADYLQDYATVGGTYELAATYCQPNSGAGNILQILTHGIGFDRSYWDFPANGYNYSYVGPAVDDYGFSTLTWDRLGIAESSRGDPINEIQAWLEVAALKALTDKARAGELTPGVGAFDKIVHVGHSFGSAHTYALTAMYPDASDGIILTGFSQNGSYVPQFLLGGAFVPANSVPALSDYVDGYMASGYEGATHIGFFAPGDFDPAILTAAYQTGKPVTVGELLTIGGETATPNSFSKPVLIITGERDVPFCGGDCFATGNPDLPSIPAFSGKILSKADPFEAYIVKGAAHGLTLGYSHVETTSKMLDFFVQNGLGCN